MLTQSGTCLLANFKLFEPPKKELHRFSSTTFTAVCVISSLITDHRFKSAFTSFRNLLSAFHHFRLIGSFSLASQQQITFQFFTPIFLTNNVFFSTAGNLRLAISFASNQTHSSLRLCFCERSSTLLKLSCTNKQCRPIGFHLLYCRATSASMTSYECDRRPGPTIAAVKTSRPAMPDCWRCNYVVRLLQRIDQICTI